MSYLKIFLIIIFTTILSIFAIIFAVVDRSLKLYVFLSRIYGRGVLIISGIKLEKSFSKKIDQDFTCVYVSNHSSQFDIPAMQAAVPNRMGFIFKKELARIPLFGWQLGMGSNIVIDRQNAEKAIKSIQKAKEKMENKNISPLVFAEGTRSKTGEVQKFKRGAFYLAAKSGFPVVPVTIIGTNKILPKGKFKIRTGTIQVHFDEPIDTKNIESRNDEIELMNRVREIIINNKEKFENADY